MWLHKKTIRFRQINNTEAKQSITLEKNELGQIFTSPQNLLQLRRVESHQEKIFSVVEKDKWKFVWSARVLRPAGGVREEDVIKQLTLLVGDVLESMASRIPEKKIPGESPPPRPPPPSWAPVVQMSHYL